MIPFIKIDKTTIWIYILIQLQRMTKQTICYRNGFYTGDLLWGVPHGSGCWTTSVFKYQGGFSCGKRHGEGSLTWLHDQSIIKGLFKNDLIYDGADTCGRIWQKGVLYDTPPSVTDCNSVPIAVKPLEIKPLEVKPSKLFVRKPLAKKMVSINVVYRSRKHPRKQKHPRRSPVI